VSGDASTHPALRLVNTPVASTPAPLPARHAVSRENERAAGLSTTDARWAIAAAAAHALEGGTAAVLRPERRERLVKLATSLGLRPFDASLIIAIVQDAARTGQGPLGPIVADRLTLIREPSLARTPEDTRAAIASLLTAVALGAMLLMSMVLWILR
jgi:hypothetical protein